MRSILPKWEGDAMQLSQLARDFVKDFERPIRGHSPMSVRKYDDDIRQFVAYVMNHGGADSVREFTPDRVEGFIRFCESKGIGGATIGAKLSALSSMAQFGMRQRDGRGKYLLAENPLLRVERPKRRKPPERYLYRDEVLALLNVEAPPNEQLALWFLFYTNLRATAAAEAKARNLTLAGDRVVLSVIEKGDNPDTFVLPTELAEPLVASLKQREAGPDEPLLVNTEGRAYTRQSLSLMVYRNAIKAGITRVRVGTHLFNRHSLASLAGQDGASEFEIAAMLRHRGTQTARKYVHGVSADATRARVWGLVRG